MRWNKVLFGHVVNQVLARERGLRRALSRRSGLDVFLQIDDAHGWLLVQLLGMLLADLPDEDMRLHVVPPPARDVDPEPELRLAWTVTDARLLATHHGLDSPVLSAPPAADRVKKGQGILLVDRPGREPLDLAAAVLREVWSHDGTGLDTLARTHGEVAASEHDTRLSAHADLLRRLGHYQGSMVLHRGEWFWGVDRFGLLERSLGRARSVLGWADGVEAPNIVGDDGRVRIELFFSFRSPYSYLVLDQLKRVADRPRVDLVIRPVLPMVMRGLPVPRVKRFYILRDCKRLALQLGAPFGTIVDPVGRGVERCMAVFRPAEEAGLATAFAHAVATAVWSEAADLTTDAGLRRIVERCGLSWSDAERGLADETSWRTMAHDNQSALFEAGLWGVPSMRLGEVAFWGQDRIPILGRMLDAAGV